MKIIEIVKKLKEAKEVLKKNDPHLANYILRDLQITKDLGLDDLCWAYHKDGNPTQEEILEIIKKIEEVIYENS